MRLTIGTAVYDDYDGLFFTLEALRTYHRLRDCQAELVIVDNHPEGEFAEDIAHYVGMIKEIPARLVPLKDPVGTSPARDEIFRNAQGDIVLVIDCHVLIEPGGLEALLRFFHDHPHPAIVSGPIVLYDHAGIMTHFDMVWRDGMWGIWAQDPRGFDRNATPFRIPAMGLGLFACRRRDWPGFHPLARGFGGEECYIHEKMRQRGGDSWCVPSLRWIHRFHNQKRPTRYPNLWSDRIRNYILEYLELGRDVEELAQHFTREKAVMTREDFDTLHAKCRQEWEKYLATNGIASRLMAPALLPTPAPQTISDCGCRGNPSPVPFAMIEQWAQFEAVQGGDWTGLTQLLTDAARGCDIVVDLYANSASCASVLAARIKKYVAINPGNPTAWWHQAVAVKGDTQMVYLRAMPAQVTVPESDLLIVQNLADADDLLRVLTVHRPRRRVVILGVNKFGESNGPAGRPGLLPGVRKFVRDTPGWIVIKYVDEGPGLLILSADPADRKPLPPAWKQVANFARAVASHIATGMGKVSAEILEQRLSICALCDKRTVDAEGRDRCSICGCPLVGGATGTGGKAEWADQECPLGKWVAIRPEQST